MAVSEADQLPDVDALVGTDQRQLVSKSDIHVAETVLGQLAHLSGAGVSNHTLALKEDLIQFAGAGRAHRRHTANDPIVFNQLNHYLAWQHALRAVGNVDICLLAGLLGEGEIRAQIRQPLCHLLGRAYR